MSIMSNRISRALSIHQLCFIAISLTIVSSMDLNNVKFVELNDSRLVATSNYNYAIASPKLQAKSWRTVSVNGDKVFIVTVYGESLLNTRSQMPQPDVQFFENLRDEIANSNAGYRHISSASGSSSGNGNFMMSSSTTEGSSTSYSSSTSGGFTSSTFGGPHTNDMSISMKDESNFSVSKSNLPFNWSRVFFNGELVTIVTKDGEVTMKPITVLEAGELEAANKLKQEVKAMQRSQSQQFSNTMQHSMDMVSNVFNNILGSFPKPPNYESAVSNMFGNNFPFGPNNSPFSSSSGWPFSGGSFAFASGR